VWVPATLTAPAVSRTIKRLEKGEDDMKTIRSCSLFRAALLMGATAILGVSTTFAQSGEVKLGNSTIESAFDDTTGNPVFYLETSKSPMPVKANASALAPLYAVVYPINSSISDADMNCQPTNCDHLEVLPFPDPDYGQLNGSDPACQAFNGGQPCSRVKGHDHLIGIASTGGDFNVPWQVKLVIFNSKAFADGAINTAVTTLSQLQSLVNTGDVFIIDTPITFDCAVVSGQTYDRGTPLVVQYP
jgi:hypothetical protein